MKRKSLYWGFLPLMFVASCANEEVVEINSGPEIAFSTRMTRADVINSVADLKEFKVYAKSEGYNSFWLIDNETAKYSAPATEPTKTIFSMENTYHWPSGVNNIEFWAFTSGDKDVTFSKEYGTITCKPVSYDKDKITNSGTKQTDLIFAYTKAGRSQASSVELNFKHALSQIEVKAYNPSQDDGNPAHVGNKYNVFIRGAWIVNTSCHQATLSWNPNPKTENKETNINWNSQTGLLNILYGCEFTETLNLKGTNSVPEDLLSSDNNLMLLPQQLNYWDLSTDKGNTQAGAYILLLCRIEVKHNGAYHEDGKVDGYVESKVDADNHPYHLHQMFPTEKDGQFNSLEYGYVAVPIFDKDEDGNKIPMVWEAGKKYTFVLEFCGHRSGAGLYPPSGFMELGLPQNRTSNNDNYRYISEIPDVSTGTKKEPGDPVLDSPIQFTVSVTNWDDSWKNGNVPMN